MGYHGISLEVNAVWIRISWQIKRLTCPEGYRWRRYVPMAARDPKCAAPTLSVRGVLPGAGARTACKPGSVWRPSERMSHTRRPFVLATTLRRLPHCNLPGRSHPETGLSAPCGKRRLSAPSLFGLAPRWGLPCHAPLPDARWALTATLSSLPFCPQAKGRSCFLLHCPWGHPRRALPGTVFPWSPDFPHPAGFPRWPGAAIRPSGPV